MNIIGIFILILILCGVFIGVYAIANHTNTAPVDSYGNTVTEDANRSAGNASAVMRSGAAVIPWIVILIGVIAFVGVFFWANDKYSGNMGRGL